MKFQVTFEMDARVTVKRTVEIEADSEIEAMAHVRDIEQGFADQPYDYPHVSDELECIHTSEFDSSGAIVATRVD